MEIALNIDKIEQERTRLGWSKTRLAKEIGISKQLLNYAYNNRLVKHAPLFGKVFNLDPKDLICVVLWSRN